VILVLILAVVFLVGTASTHEAILGVVFTAIAFVVLWAVSIHLTPFRRCRTCKGTGRQTGAVFTWAHRVCPTCAGSGRHRRYHVTAIYGSNLTRGERRAYAARFRRIRPRP
jgi:hypothetical protein